MLKAKQFRFRMKAFKRNGNLIETPPQVIAQSLLMEPDLFDGEDESGLRRAARNHNRLIRWAVGKSHNELIDAIGRLAWEASYQRSSKKFASKNVDHFRAKFRLARAQSTKQHKRAGELSHVGRPSHNAKVEAQNMWGLAERSGWDAPTFLRKLELRGHEVGIDALRKWIRTLRAGKNIITPEAGDD